MPVGKIYRAPDMLSDPHFKAREAIIRVPHPQFGELAMQNVVPKLSLTPGSVRNPGPKLGEHNRQIFVDRLGIAEAEFQSFQESGII